MVNDMYESPIEMLVSDIRHQIVKQQDDEIYKAVLHYVPNVNKEELIRALKYDREQYQKGYADGKADAGSAVKHGEWIEEEKRPKGMRFICSECAKIAYFPQPTRDKKWVKRCGYKYCPNCGAIMDMKGE